jgi:photosystem II stability/assembly factor-like uncharacterized protein
MPKIYNLILPFLMVVLLFSCKSHSPSTVSKLNNKCEPYDQFAFQRSFPDSDFNWKGWQHSMADIRVKEAAKAKLTDCVGAEVNWTQQGPANVGARCNTLAVKPDDENTVLAGFAGGGIFKSTDGGVNWHPVFDDHLELCISDITFDINDPNVVYAGTGDPNLPAIVFNGNGVYKSIDAGETWTYLGLSEQGITSKVLVHPDSPKILFAAAMGNPYIRDNHRGIYKSINGGISWQQVLFVSNQAGASDLVQSPTNPDILYASFWDRIRSNTESVIYGPNAKVYKSTDGGDSWVLLGGGLPTGTMGRTGLAISPENPDKVYVVFVDSLSEPGGLYKTINGGATWTSLNINALGNAYSDFGWYFGKIRLNPINDEEVYFLGVQMYRKPAGSNSWVTAGSGHPDYHDLVFTPSGRRYIATDGGVYRNDAGQMFWTKCKNLPVTQFYHTTFNPHEPNVYWGGTQDNGIQKGAGGAAINDWSLIFLADGFHCAFDPNDAQTFWVEIQNGAIHKTTNGGSSWQFGTSSLGTTDRVSWDAPFFMSRFSTTKLFSATYRVYNSFGNSWSAISPDLTDGIIYSPRFHTITALQESPKIPEKLMAGTSDGNVWRREPTGGWINITGSLPDRYVTSVQLSGALPQRLFVTNSGFRDDEYIPHVHRSDDNGATWIDISGDLPQMPVNDLFIMPNHADSVLFVATDAGVYCTKNRGQTWNRLGNNMPIIPVFDLEENPVRKELVAATFARGIWTFPLDSVFSQHQTVSVTISGTVTTETGMGVPEVNFGTEKSDADGNFQIHNVPGCTPYSLTPFRNDNPLNGLTTFDLVLISKHILGIEALGSPFKMMAADANRSNSITSFDIVSLRKLILGIDTALVGNTSWRFVPTSHDFINPTNPFLNTIPGHLDTQLASESLSDVNFTAVKVGDVNNTVVPSALSVAKERTLGEYSLAVQDYDYQVAEKVVVPFRGEMSDVIAVQFTLNFDTSQLMLQSIEPIMDGITLDNFGLHQSRQGLVSVSIQQTESAAAPFFNIVFIAKKSGKLSRSLKLGDLPTPSLAFREDGSGLQPVLWQRDVHSAAVVFAPNPFGEAGTWMDYQAAPGANEQVGVTLEIFDVQGKVVFSKQINGSQRIQLSPAIFPQSGVYFWRLGAGGQAGKLVFRP